MSQQLDYTEPLQPAKIRYSPVKTLSTALRLALSGHQVARLDDATAGLKLRDPAIL